MDPDALGKPGEGIHFHVCGIAIVDLGLTALAAWGLARWLDVSAWWMFAFLMVVGLLVHHAIGVRTKLTKLVFG